MKRKGRMTLFLALVLLLGAIAGAPYATAESKQSAEQIETDNKTEDNPTSAEKRRGCLCVAVCRRQGRKCLCC